METLKYPDDRSKFTLRLSKSKREMNCNEIEITHPKKSDFYRRILLTDNDESTDPIIVSYRNIAGIVWTSFFNFDYYNGTVEPNLLKIRFYNKSKPEIYDTIYLRVFDDFEKYPELYCKDIMQELDIDKPSYVF